MPNLTENELRAVAYYAVGVSSEGSDIAYTLSFCGDTTLKPDGSVTLRPIGNSGYTIGEMQTDFGAQPATAKLLVDSFQNWAKDNHKDWVLSEDKKSQLADDLGRNGRHIRDANYDTENSAYMKQHHGSSMPDSLLPIAGQDIDQTFKAHLNAYLASDAGKTFTHQTDITQVNELMTNVSSRLDNTKLYINATSEDQSKLFSIVAKAYNQGPAYVVGSKHIVGIFDDIDSGKINNLADLNKKVDSFPEYMRTGRDAALKGAETFNALSNASERNPLHEPWRAVVANPLVNPTQVSHDPKQPHFADQYATVKGIFVEPVEGKKFVDALGKGDSLNYGDPASSHSRGFYAEGNDFVQWDKNGQGRAFVGGQWSESSRSELSLAHNKDHTLDINLTRGGETHSLLHVEHPTQGHVHAMPSRAHAATTDTLHQGMHNEQVQKLQTQLGELGYLDNTGTPDGKFGPATAAAVKSFQHDHHLPEVGQAGPATKSTMQADLQPLKQNDPGPLPAVSAMSSLHLTAPGLDDPRHALNPDNGLYNKLKTTIPDASEQRLLQFTAACHEKNITDKNLNLVHFNQKDGLMAFASGGLTPSNVTVDVKQPSPPTAESIQQIQTHDGAQMQLNHQIQTQIQTQNAQAQQGPVPGGSPMPGGGGQ